MRKISPRWLSFAVLILLLTNGSLIVFWVMERSRSHAHSATAHREQVFERMTRALGYTEAQKEQHRGLRKAHLKETQPFYDSIRQAKITLYSRTSILEESDSFFINYMRKMSGWQTTINKLNYLYYKKVRRLLTPEQQPRYDSMLVKMMERVQRDSARQR